jgi:hypothetical protein
MLTDKNFVVSGKGKKSGFLSESRGQPGTILVFSFTGAAAGDGQKRPHPFIVVRRSTR